MENKNYYEILGVSEKATFDEITKAKNALAKKYHPDANLKHGIDTTEQMQEILEAYQILSDADKRKEYNQILAGSRKRMQTFDLSHMEEEENTGDSDLVRYWKAAGKLFDIITESETLFKERKRPGKLSKLSDRAARYVLFLKGAEIPERYWHPDIMNWLLFTWYQNRNYTIPYLLTLYDKHVKEDLNRMDWLKMQKTSMQYQHAIKKLVKY